MLSVAVLCSRRAPGLSYLLESDANLGRTYELTAVVTSDPECIERDRVIEAGVPWVVHDIRAFYAARGATLRDLDHRAEYDLLTARLLAPFRPDLVLLCGYLHIVTAPLLEAYPDRVLNIHDSDLAQVDDQGRPRNRGLHAVRDAIFAGEHETRSSVHVVTPEVDGGPLLLRSWAFETHPLVDAAREWGATDMLKAYAYAQREWMMRAAWGPLLAAAIDLAAQGEIRVRDGHPRTISAAATRVSGREAVAAW